MAVIPLVVMVKLVTPVPIRDVSRLPVEPLTLNAQPVLHGPLAGV